MNRRDADSSIDHHSAATFSALEQLQARQIVSLETEIERLRAVVEATRGVEFSDQPGAEGSAQRLLEALRGLA